MILKEFDSNKRAVINPTDIIEATENFPKIAVSCFAYQTFNRLVNELKAEQIAKVSMANMKIPVYKANYKDEEIALFMSYVGAAGCISVLGDIFAMGAEKMVIFGTCGVLDVNIQDCSIIVPNKAIRDEGTSFHYAPETEEIEINKKYKEEFKQILEEYGCNYTEGKAWTTDGIYRETREKIRRRKEQGCICVDMECSAVAALSDFRGKEVFHFFYAADNLDHEVWDKRSLSNSANLLEKDKIALLAMELAIKMI